MTEKSSENAEPGLSPVFFGSSQKSHVYVFVATGLMGVIGVASGGMIGPASIGGIGTGIVNTMLYESLRKLFVSQTNTAITAQIEKVLNWLLHQNVLIPFPDAIRNYLLQHFDMLKLLPLVCKIAIDRVGASSQLSLEVYHDPEIHDEYLTLYIRRPDYDESVSKLIEEVSSECQEHLSDSTGWLLVTTDFRAPQ